ncbi:MAG: hypothetical protein JXR42_00290, partial [Gammaproteobacteria bacterium]|nr:hypothetical protein [Gammaproteobacteria bacterium]
LTPSQLELNLYQQADKLGYSLGIPKAMLQDKLQNASLIRWIKPLQGKGLRVEPLLDLLEVDFVQASQSGSVLPFFLGDYLVYKG